MRMTRLLSVATLAVLPLAGQAELIYGISVPGASTNLVSFDSAAPNTVSTVGAITGIVAGHTLRGIDFRPATGQLYALSSNGANAQLYTINLSTGAASAVGGTIVLAGNTSTRISLDFNPVVDRLRIVTGSGQNYRLNVDTGALTQDTNISGSPLISGIAYTNNVAGATQTTLYGYDFISDSLGTIGGINGVPSPNGGLFNVIGSSGIVTGDAGLGMDISGATGDAFVTVDDFNGSPGFNAEFFRVNLGTGAFTQLSNDDFGSILDISVFIAAVPLPATLSLALLGLAAMGVVRRRTAPAAA
jgi:hypothetical protein